MRIHNTLTRLARSRAKRPLCAAAAALCVGGPGALTMTGANVAASSEAANAIQYLPGCEDSVLLANDDGSSDVQELGFQLNFYGNAESQLYINNNGNISFGDPISTFTPDGLSTAHHPSIIAPFWADIDTRVAGASAAGTAATARSGLATKEHASAARTSALSGEASSIAPPAADTVTFGQTTFNGHAAYCVLWHDVGYFSQHTDKVNDFQLLIVDRADQGTTANGDDFDFYFNYDQVQWESGDASGGQGGLGGACAEIGYTNGTGRAGTWFQRPNPSACSVLLDSDATGLVHGSQGTAVVGSYLFNVRGGTVTPVLTAHDLSGTFDISGATASFTDANPVSDLSATIDWGDGSGPQPAAVSSALSGDTISGSHHYAHDGLYTATTVLTDTNIPGHTFSTTSRITAYVPFILKGSPFTTASTLAPHATATFTDADSSNAATNYFASIDWGDGTGVTPGAITTTGTPPVYSVAATHEFGPASVATHHGRLSVVTTVTYVRQSDTGTLTHSESVTVPVTVVACSDTLDPSLGTSWLSGVAWSSGGPPGPTDDACISGDHDTTVSIDGALETPVNSLTLFSTGAAGPTLALCPSTASTALAVTHNLTVGGHTSLLVGDGPCSLSAGGQLLNYGTVTTCSASVHATGGIFNAGTFHVSDATTCAPHAAAAVARHSVEAGVLRAAAPATTSSANAVAGAITNAGMLAIDTGDSLTASSFTQNPTGTLSIGVSSQGAGFTVLGPARLAGSLNVPGASALQRGAVTALMTYHSESGSFSRVSGATGGQAAYGPTTMSFVIGRLTPLVTLIGPSAPVYGAPAHYRAEVTLPASLPHTLPAPTGSVQFLDNSHVIATPSVQSGAASAAPRLQPGRHTITAKYLGTSLYSPATVSAVVSQSGPSAGGRGVTGSSNNLGVSSGVLGTSTGSSGATTTGTTTPPQNPNGGNPSGGNPSGGNPSGGSPSGGSPSGGSPSGGTPSGGGTPSHSGESSPAGAVGLPSIVSVLSPLQISTSLKLIAVNLLLALLLVLLLALPAELLNSAVRENYSDITRWMRITGGRMHRLHRVTSELPTHFTLIFVMVMGALLYTFIDPAFGFNLATGAELLGLLGAFLVITVTHDIARGLYLRRRLKQRSRLTTFPAGIVFAVGLVVISRIFHFQPGFIFGLMTGLAFGSELSDREDGRGLAFASIIVLLVAVAAWFIWIPVKQTVDGTSDPGFLYVVLDTLLATVWVAGIQSIIFAFIPLKFMDGEKVVRWSKVGWLSIYVLSMFIFVHTVLHPTSTRFGNSDQTSIVSLLMLLIGFTVFAAIVWTIFYVRHRRRAPIAVEVETAHGV